MTSKQKIIKLMYPMVSSFSRLIKGNTGIAKMQEAASDQSFYGLQATLSNGTQLPFHDLKGKKVLLVNVASECGFTPQYGELEKLQQLYPGELVILGFPSNDFKGQEPGTDEAINAFCATNYGISFPLMKKHPVLPPGQHEVFEWLTQKEKNGWNDQLPSWNFSKYLVNEQGQLSYVFAPYISPLSREVEAAIRPK